MVAAAAEMSIDARSLIELFFMTRSEMFPAYSRS